MSRDQKEPRNHALTAAVIGGAAAAATAGAMWSARALARRNGAGDGKPINSVMRTAMTACEVAHGPGTCGDVAPEPQSRSIAPRELTPAG